MSIESGSISGRFFHVPQTMPQNAVERFASRAMPPLETLGDGVITGWTSGRHALDRVITDDNAFFGGYLRLALTQAERKVPEALLRAECRMEEQAHMQAHGVEKVGGATRREIRRSVEQRLIPHAQPQLRQIPFVLDSRYDRIVSGALSDKQVDALQVHFAQTVGFSLIPLTPDMASLKRMQVNVRDWRPTSFSPERDDEEVTHDPGLDFLTWLWFVAEARGGVVVVPNLGSVAIMIEGPLLLTCESAGSHETFVRKGEPMLSAETKSALMAGKKLRRAKLTLAMGDKTWTCTLDAVTLAFRGLTLPEGEKLDPISRFQSRMDDLATWHDALFGLFDHFVIERQHATNWDLIQTEMREWVKTRKAR